MNVRKLMARLNATTVRYDVGRGGIPESTPLDVAGALAAVEPPLARDILCLVWWPDGSAVSRGAVNAAVRNEIMAEFSRRHRAAQIARLDLHLLESELAARRGRTSTEEQALCRAQAVVDCTRAALWPCSQMALYPAIVSTVLLELATPRLCAKCGGRGDVLTAAGPRQCETCGGCGQRSQSNAWRARQLGNMDEATYRSTWRPVYDWAYNYVEGMEMQAARALEDALGAGEICDAPAAA